MATLDLVNNLFKPIVRIRGGGSVRGVEGLEESGGEGMSRARQVRVIEVRKGR